MTEETTDGWHVIPIVVNFVLIPAILLAIVYGASIATGVHFGDILFVLTGIAGVSWFAATGWGRRISATNRWHAIASQSDIRYGQELADRTSLPLSPLGRGLTIFTVTVVWGWVVVFFLFH